MSAVLARPGNDSTFKAQFRDIVLSNDFTFEFLVNVLQHGSNELHDGNDGCTKCQGSRVIAFILEEIKQKESVKFRHFLLCILLAWRKMYEV